MPTEDVLSDSYIAELLKKDAADRSLRYSAIGLQALLPNRRTANAPKPNTRFLRNIIRETHSHNAALGAKEADESRARLRSLQGEPDRGGRKSKDGLQGYPRGIRESGEAASNRESRRSKRRRIEHDDSDDERDRRSRCHRSSHRSSRRGDDPEREMRKSTRSKEDDSLLRSHRGREDEGRRRRRSRSDERPRRKHDRNTGRRRRRRSRSRTRSSVGELAEDEIYPRTRRRRHSSVSSSSPHRSPPPHRRELRSSKPNDTTSLPPPSPSDSDPLTALIGPKPEPAFQPRGRGALSSSIAIDAHFSPTYNPALDIQPSTPPSNTNGNDDWDRVLESLRDRERWKQVGAKRLRDAGFTEGEVKRWEGGGGRKEEDVKWGSRGEGREWDRGKVVGEDGWVDVRAEWGRLGRS